jgi:hypothetical protein
MSRIIIVLCAMLGCALLVGCGGDHLWQPQTCSEHAFVVASGPLEIAGDYCGVERVPVRWTLRSDRSFTRVASYPRCPEGVACVWAGGATTSEGTYRQDGTLLRLTFQADHATANQLWTVSCAERTGLSLLAPGGKVFAPSGCP